VLLVRDVSRHEPTGFLPGRVLAAPRVPHIRGPNLQSGPGPPPDVRDPTAHAPERPYTAACGQKVAERRLHTRCDRSLTLRTPSFAEWVAWGGPYHRCFGHRSDSRGEGGMCATAI
jgi:hypothetical protein